MFISHNLYLRRLEKSDLERTLAWVNDPEIFITMGLWGPRTASEQEDWYNLVSNSKTNIVFAICKNDSNEHIGNASLFDIDYRSRNAGLTIFMYDKSNQGKGYGPEVIKMLCEYVFDFINLHKVYCKTDNPNAEKMYEKFGFVCEGNLREHVFRYGKYVDKKMYGLLSKDFIGN